MSGVRLKGIRRVQKSAALHGKPGVEIVLHTPKPLYIGALLWVLHIGRHRFDLGGTDGPQTMTYILTLKEWGKVKDGDPLHLTYGVADRRERAPTSGFALLNKKMLKKK